MFSTVLTSVSLAIPTSVTPQEILVGDYNGDGLPDLFVPTLNFASDGSSSPLLFLTGKADGTFVDSTAALSGGTVPTAVFAGRVVTGDFNGDGRPDFFIIDSGPDKAPFPGGQNELLLSTPTGYTNATANLPQLTIFSHGAAVGDINNDGNLDVVVFALNANGGSTPNSGPAIQILEGNGKGGFADNISALPALYQQTGYNAGSTWGGLFDLNGDGYADLVVGTWPNSSQPTEVYLNDGHGSFANSQPIVLPATGLGGDTVVQALSADINGDGKPDLILSVTNLNYTVPYIQILINDGTGHFTDQTQARLPQSLTAASTQDSWFKFLTFVDVDGDGDKDIIASNESQDTTTIFLNDGTGHFTTVATQLSGADAAPLYHAGAAAPYAFAVNNNHGQIIVVANDLPQSEIATAMQTVLRTDPTGSAVLAAVASGTETLGAALQALPDAALSTTSVATLAYQFFTGHTPSLAGLDYLVSPTGPNPNNLNSAYYAGFSTLNRYINFASNLGKVGEGAAAFQAAYGGLSLADTTSKTYAAIFGSTPTADKVNHLLHDLVPNGLGGTYEREDYFASYGLDGLTGQGTKAAMVGWLLGTAASSDIGTLQTANLAYLEDVATGKASGSVDLVGTYHGTPYTGA